MKRSKSVPIPSNQGSQSRLYNVVFRVGNETKISLAYATSEFALWLDLIDSYKPSPVEVITYNVIPRGAS